MTGPRGGKLLPSRLIEKKRRGEFLSPEELDGFFRGYLEEEIHDYQMAAFLMAVHFQGMDGEEMGVLLELMIDSGSRLDLSHLSGPVVDKHSTGGVGDKTSLVLAPLAAELGLFVPMMSGRGLGHTAGTLDKLEAIPGFRTSLSLAEFRGVLEEVGVAMMGQTEEIAPLDRRLYALRDATATVPSLPLIATSIMSKKLGEGIGGLVLDVKTGSGSFLSDVEESRELARTMTSLGEERGVRTTALVTEMGRPLGRAVGNGLETMEAFACLAGEGPADLKELCAALVGEMLLVGGVVDTAREGRERALTALGEGRAVPRMARLVEAQGGDPAVVEDPGRMPAVPEVEVARAPRSGHVHEIRPVELGYGVVELGGGRRNPGEELDARVGFVLAVSPGDAVEEGEPLGEVHAADEAGLRRGARILRDAVVLAPEAPADLPPLLRDRIPGPLS